MVEGVAVFGSAEVGWVVAVAWRRWLACVVIVFSGSEVGVAVLLLFPPPPPQAMMADVAMAAMKPPSFTFSFVVISIRDRWLGCSSLLCARWREIGAAYEGARVAGARFWRGPVAVRWD